MCGSPENFNPYEQMMRKHVHVSVQGQAAIAALLTFFIHSTEGAGIVLPAGGTVLTPGSTNPGGTVVADITSPFSGPGGLFSGTLRSLAVKEAGGTFDFYYQLTNTSTNPLEFIDGFVASNFTGFSTEVDWSTNGLLGISGAGAFSLGSTPSESAMRDLSPPDDVAFFLPFGSLNNSGAQNPSAFFYIRTNATDYQPGQVLVSGAGTTPPIASFAPAIVPEPSSVLFGMALASFAAGRRIRHRRVPSPVG